MKRVFRVPFATKLHGVIPEDCNFQDHLYHENILPKNDEDQKIQILHELICAILKLNFPLLHSIWNSAANISTIKYNKLKHIHCQWNE